MCICECLCMCSMFRERCCQDSSHIRSWHPLSSSLPHLFNVCQKNDYSHDKINKRQLPNSNANSEKDLMYKIYIVTHCAGCILANVTPHQLCWGEVPKLFRLLYTSIPIHTSLPSNLRVLELCPLINFRGSKFAM